MSYKGTLISQYDRTLYTRIQFYFSDLKDISVPGFISQINLMIRHASHAIWKFSCKMSELNVNIMCLF